ncbi:phenolic glucoside malonyltransferase 1-like [Melia azedarach]|uniref:Phenolic glucoside malonyltransferase 1-like n=1 Tax=Melia azedarach TaxID=155640 RepID=A0ACC1X802_MELAZ|nr:phenolic glucoside malonyltransferase 1-like [Melia azedarach]
MAATIDNRIKIHEVTRITPFSNPTAEFSLPLTLFDTYWLKFLPVGRLFFYQITELTSDLFNSVVLPKLKHSLSLTLLHYLPLAGNLMWPEDTAKPAIYYFPNDGVAVTIAESNADFNTLCGDGVREAVEFRPLTPHLSISDDKAAPISIQITLFPNQGFCIGISIHHAIFDGRSSAMFMKSWACLCKQDEENPSLPPELTPSFDRTVIKDPKGIDLVYVNNWLAFTGSDSDQNKRSLKVMPSIVDVNKLVRATFVLTRQHIKKLRDKILSASNVNEVKLHLSTFVLTCAYVYTCMAKARGGESNRDVLLVFTADYRNRLDPPVPANYFGNCVGSHITNVKARGLMDETGVFFVAEKLSVMIKEIENGITLEGFEDKLLKLMSLMKQAVEGAQGLGVAGSIRFDVYGSDFGWGRPKKVEIVSIDTTGAISLAESRDEDGGVEIGLVLSQQEMEIFSSLFEKGLKDIV